MNPNLKKGSKQKEHKLTNSVIFKQKLFKPPLQEISEKKKALSNKSPYNEIMPKIRSESQLKNISTTNSGVVSPLFGSSASISIPTKKISLKSTLVSNSSILAGINKAKHHGKSFGNLNEIMTNTHENPDVYEITEKELIDLGRKLGKLERLHANNQITYEVFDAYKRIFDEIIEKDTTFGPILNKIKLVYESWTQGKLGHVAENAQLKFEIVGFNKIIKEIKTQNQMLMEKISQISEENAKLGKDAEIKNDQYRSLQEYLIRIENTKSEGFTKDETTWKLLIAENNSYLEVCEGMKRDIKKLKLNEKKMMKLFNCLKIQGYPVDEIYNEKIKTRRKMKKANRPVASEDEENINITPAKTSIKPSLIPVLKLPAPKNIAVDLSQSSECSYNNSDSSN